MLVEHGGYDTDESCDDPSCPCNEISRQTTHIIHNYSDLKFISEDRIAGIFLSKKSIELDRMPSIEFELSIIDEFLKNYTNVIWIEVEQLISFKEKLTQILKVGYGKANLEAMSVNEFSLEIESIDRSGHMVISYSVSGYKMIEVYNKTYRYQNIFQFEFNQLETYINRINKVLE